MRLSSGFMSSGIEDTEVLLFDIEQLEVTQRQFNLRPYYRRIRKFLGENKFVVVCFSIILLFWYTFCFTVKKVRRNTQSWQPPFQQGASRVNLV